MNIRFAQLEDISKLVEIREKAIIFLARNSYSAEELKTWLSRDLLQEIRESVEKEEIWVYEEEGIVKGWGQREDSSIRRLYTHPQYSRQGIGSRLLRYIESILRNEGNDTVFLEASRNAISFYEKHEYMLCESSEKENTCMKMKKIL